MSKRQISENEESEKEKLDKKYKYLNPYQVSNEDGVSFEVLKDKIIDSMEHHVEYSDPYEEIKFDDAKSKEELILKHLTRSLNHNEAEIKFLKELAEGKSVRVLPSVYFLVKKLGVDLVDLPELYFRRKIEKILEEHQKQLNDILHRKKNNLGYSRQILKQVESRVKYYQSILNNSLMSEPEIIDLSMIEFDNLKKFVTAPFNLSGTHASRHEYNE